LTLKSKITFAFHKSTASCDKSMLPCSSILAIMKFVRNDKVQESSKIGQNLRELSLEDQELGVKAAIG